MTIHHAVAKKAQGLGFTLKEVEGEVLATSENLHITADSAKQALSLIQQATAFLNEYPWFAIEQGGDLFTVKSNGTILTQSEDLDEAIALALEEQPEAPDDYKSAGPEEEEEPGSIVPLKYKAEYAARGDATRCGDWMCEQLDPYVTNITNRPKGGTRRNTNLDLLRMVAAANGIDKDWPNLNPGQRAMNTRNMLRAKVRKTGQLIIPAAVTHSKNDLMFVDPSWVAQ